MDSDVNNNGLKIEIFRHFWRRVGGWKKGMLESEQKCRRGAGVRKGRRVVEEPEDYISILSVEKSTWLVYLSLSPFFFIARR